VANRATIGNMSPEYGSTCAIFPIDDETLTYLRLTGRDAGHVELIEAYAKAQGLWHDADREPDYSERLELDLSTVEPSLAGPKRPQDRVPVKSAKDAFRSALSDYATDDDATTNGDSANEASKESFPASDPPAVSHNGSHDGPARAATSSNGRPSNPALVSLDGEEFEVDHGAVVVAAITSCTNTSNPFVMIGAGLLAKNAVERGLSSKPWVKTSLAPGSKVVSDYYD
jgi:aconitate hydratase